MRRTDKPNGTVAVAQQVFHGDGASTMPEHFAGMYQASYDEGYTSGKEAGFKKVLRRATLRLTRAQTTLR